MRTLAFDFSCQYINFRNTVDLISEKFYSHGCIGAVGRKNFQGISTDTEGTSVEVHLISGVLNVDQLPDYLIPVFGHSRTQGNHHVKEFLRGTQSVDTGNGGNDHYVFPL